MGAGNAGGDFPGREGGDAAGQLLDALASGCGRRL
jgi:hypothetical protein